MHRRHLLKESYKKHIKYVVLEVFQARGQEKKTGCEFCQKCCQIFQLVRIALSHLCEEVKRDINPICMCTVIETSVFMGEYKKCKYCPELAPPIYMSLLSFIDRQRAV